MKPTVLLATTSTEAEAGVMTGSMFYKQIVKFGKWVNPLFPVESMELDRKWGEQIVKNFNSGIVGKIPVPLDHTDQVDRNAGEVVKLEIKDDGIYGYLDIRRPEVVDDINGGLIFDVSISFEWDYIDTKDGKSYGPTLLHVALVNNPYLKGMSPFSEFYGELSNKLSESLALSHSVSAIMLSEAKAKELSTMETATVKNDKEFDVTIKVENDGETVDKVLKAGEETQVPKDQSEAVLKQISEATDPNEETPEEKAEREKKEAEEAEAEEKRKKEEEEGKGGDDKLTDEERKELNDLREKQSLSQVESAYATLLSAGKITPAQKDKFMELSKISAGKVELSGKAVSLSDIVKGILEAGPQVVKFSEEGSEGKPEGGEGEGKDPNEGKKPSELLSEEELAGLKATGTTPEEYDRLKEKYPEMQVGEVKVKKEEKS
jgi:hypothetical protein